MDLRSVDKVQSAVLGAKTLYSASTVVDIEYREARPGDIDFFCYSMWMQDIK